MNSRQGTWPIIIALSLIFLLSACGGAVEPTEPSASTLIVPTTDVETVPTATSTTRPSPTPTELPPAPALPTSTPTIPASPTPTPVPEATATVPSYRVAYVAADDVLNVRADAGAEHEVIAELAPDAADLVPTGATAMVDDSQWVEIEIDEETGWVNGHFLTANQEADEFCADPAALAVLDQLKAAVAAQDDDALAALIHPERGLRLNRHWWNPTVLLTGAAAEAPFSSDETFEWGTADGSGEPIDGSFSQVALPLLERNLLPAEEMACNEILHGGTAGMVRLPDGYEQINYFSLYRPPGPDQIEFDWGSWVVGIELWQGEYWLAYLVHFEWEI